MFYILFFVIESNKVSNHLGYCDLCHYNCSIFLFLYDTVTCVQFNPVDDDYFISGSIDGIVRIWTISGCQVVDWTDVIDIVTALCYRPDGMVRWSNSCPFYLVDFFIFNSLIFFLQGAIIGSMTGNCCFYDASGIFLLVLCMKNFSVCSPFLVM